MKGKILWILGVAETCIGFVLFVVAQMEISSNSRYTWRKPYTSYEAQVVMTKWIGIILLISGIVWLLLKIYQLRYTNTHTQEITPLSENGGSVKCPNCGLSLSADVKTCPRCGAVTTDEAQSYTQQNSSVSNFCSNCGNKVNANERFCPKCGQKISK